MKNVSKEGKPTQRFVLSDEVVSEFERYFSLSLPKAYLLFLKRLQGEHLECCSIVPQSEPNLGRWTVSFFYRLDGDKASDTSVWTAIKIWRPILGEFSLPFACDSSYNHFYLDFRASPPVVKVCIHDEYFRSIDIAASFEAFVDGLEIDSSML